MESSSLRRKTALSALLFMALLIPGSEVVHAADSNPKKVTTQKKAKKKTPPAPVSKKNLKKGKNTDTSKSASSKKSVSQKKVAQKHPVKARASLPTQTRAEKIKLESEEAAKLAALKATESEKAEAPVAQATTESVQENTAPDTVSEDAPISDADLGSDTGGEVALDLGAGEEAKWNPYTFARSPFWIFLPIITLLIIGMHLLPVPKRIYPKKLSAVPDFLQLKDKTRTLMRPGFENSGSKAESKKRSGGSSDV